MRSARTGGLIHWSQAAQGQAQLPDLLALRLGGPTAALGPLSVSIAQERPALWWGVRQNKTTVLGPSVCLAVPDCPGNIPRTQSACPRCLFPLLGAVPLAKECASLLFPPPPRPLAGAPWGRSLGRPGTCRSGRRAAFPSTGMPRMVASSRPASPCDLG